MAGHEAPYARLSTLPTELAASRGPMCHRLSAMAAAMASIKE